ncbi:MAG: ATP-binding protein [Bacteroidia bacterium]
MPDSQIDNPLQTRYIIHTKEVYLQLEDYQFFHSPYAMDEGKNDIRFIGRQKLSSHLRMILENSQTKSGAYLVTGFRGMGKTSLVRKVIKEINVDRKAGPVPVLKPIEISLAQDDLNETHVFRYICRHLRVEMEYLLRENPSVDKSILEDETSKPGRIIKALKDLDERIFAEVRLSSGENNDETGNGRLFINRSLDKFFPVAGPKEMEWQLIRILEKIEELRPEKPFGLDIPEFIFVFDELDKIEPNSKFTISEKESEDPNYDLPETKSSTDKIRKRKETVAALLANLKNFLNKARAKFIFIGGREMYDASLADIADRDSFYSSIFHDVLYVESFLKDGISKHGSGLTRMTETYLCKLLIPHSHLMSLDQTDSEGVSWQNEAEVYNLRRYYQYLSASLKKRQDIPGTLLSEPSNREEIYRIIYLLQNFIIYLTYRSNGTPKKLTDLFEDYIVPENDAFTQNPYIQLVKIRETNPVSEREKKKPLYLHFSATDQYVIGLTSVMFRPYIITHSRHQKIWGDKLLFSTAYIIDHIFKFHPFGFSWRNLELIPELITINKAPQLRAFISELLEHYSNTYIRTTTGGLFHFKFFNKNANEIKCVSKISDLSLAAFNFTLDESLMIKRHYYKKLKDLRKSHANYTRYEGKSGFVHSIGFVHGILGDLHYYDKEFDEAIIQYSDAIQHLRAIDIHQLTEHQVILMITNKLKLGLTLEKIHSYESAFTVYREIIEKLPVFFANHSQRKDQLWDKMLELKEESEISADNGFRGFRLLNQSYMAILEVLEKMGTDGLTDTDLKKYEAALMNFLGVNPNQNRPPGSRKLEKNVSVFMPELKNTLVANYYSNVGSLLFFKNKNFPSTVLGFQEFDRKFRRKVIAERLISVNSNAEKATYNLFHEYLKELGGLEEYDFNPSLSAYVYYRECQRWLLLRFDQELAPVRKLIKEVHSEDHSENKTQQKSKRTSTIFDGLLLKDGSPQNHYLLDIFILLSDEIARPISANHSNDLGNIFSKIGDSLLTFVSQKNNRAPGKEIFKLLFEEREIFKKKNQDKDSPDKPPIRSWISAYRQIADHSESIYSLDMVLFCYRLSAQFFLKASQIYSYAFQYKKVLYLLKDFLAGYSKNREEVNKLINWEGFIPFIKEKIAIEIIKAITWENKAANRPQVLKYKDVFALERVMELRDAQSLINNVSTGTETWETVMLVSDIQLKLTRINWENGKKNNQSVEEDHYLSFTRLDLKQDFVFYSPHTTASSRFLKIMEHKYKADLNRLYLKVWGFEDLLIRFEEAFAEKKREKKQVEISYEGALNEYIGQNKIPSVEKIKATFGNHPDFTPEIKDHKDILEYLITDSLFHLAELIQNLNLYGINYMTSYSYLGFSHYRLATWSSYYRTILRIQGDKKDERNRFFRNLSGCWEEIFCIIWT